MQMNKYYVFSKLLLLHIDILIICDFLIYVLYKGCCLPANLVPGAEGNRSALGSLTMALCQRGRRR
jgi:hypothetical protein